LIIKAKRERGRELIRSFWELIRELIHFIEIIFMGYLLGISFESEAFAIVSILFLLVVVYLFPVVVLPLAWAVVIFFWLQEKFPQSSFYNLIFAVLAGGIRFFLLKRK
jgi:hypothetical protein